MMGRANLCDAEFCNKAAAGNADDIRPCIGCLRCLNGIMFGKRISCTVNPDVERDEAGYEPAAEAKNVLVVGAGPAGMEAAYIAAKRGHNVVLVDKQDEPGGEMRIAAVPPAKQELTRVIKYQYRRLAEAGVKCVFGTELTAEDIQRDYAGYEVVLAYGAEPIVPAFMQGFKQVMTADDLLGGKAFPGKKIVICGRRHRRLRDGRLPGPAGQRPVAGQPRCHRHRDDQDACRQTRAVPVARCSSRVCFPRAFTC